MTFEVLDTDSGDVLAAYSSFDKARSELMLFVDDHPERSDDLALVTVDDAGHAVEILDADRLTDAAAFGVSA
jgi:hypothetical protein